MGPVHSSQLCQEPLNPRQVFYLGLRRSESSQRGLELKLCDPDGDVATRALSPAVLAAGASQELCLGFLGSQDLDFVRSLSQAWCTQGCGHRKCIHTCPGQSGAPQVSDVLLGRVELWGCDDGTPSCFPNKPTSSPLVLAFLGHALMPFPLTLAPADTGSQQGDTWFACGV